MSDPNKSALAEYKGITLYSTTAVSTALNFVTKGPEELLEEEVEEKFNFIEEEGLRKILIRDFLELETCKNRGLIKSTLVLCGSIIEALLLDQILKDDNLSNAQLKFDDIIREKEPKRVGKSPKEWWFAEVIKICEKLELVSNEAIKEVWKLNDYRQIIHPINEIDNRKNISLELAQISYHVLLMIINDLKIELQ